VNKANRKGVDEEVKIIRDVTIIQKKLSTSDMEGQDYYEGTF
jgi:hypothetical protein